MTMTEEQRRKCHQIIHSYSASGATVAAALAQAPSTDNVILVGMEVTMTIQLRAVFGAEIGESVAKGIVASVGATIGGELSHNFWWEYNY